MTRIEQEKRIVRKMIELYCRIAMLLKSARPSVK